MPSRASEDQQEIFAEFMSYTPTDPQIAVKHYIFSNLSLLSEKTTLCALRPKNERQLAYQNL